jgi:hypothetical protein
MGHLGGLLGGIAAGWVFRSRRGLLVARKEPASVPPGRTVAVPVSSDHPRADLHKELGDLGL